MVAVSHAEVPDQPQNRLLRARRLHVWLAIFLGLVSCLSLTVGATGVTPWDMAIALLQGQAPDAMASVVLFDIRLPRLFMGICVGAALAVSGAVMQGLFRNPLADPGIVGVSAGAGLGAITAIVLGGMLPVVLRDLVGPSLVPIAAFLGGWGTTLIL